MDEYAISADSHIVEAPQVYAGLAEQNRQGGRDGSESEHE